MNYKVGDTVVCIDSMSVGVRACPLSSGKKYRVIAIHGPSCVEVDQFDEFVYPWDCDFCGKTIRSGPHWYGWRFIKLDGLHEEEKAKDTATA